MNGHSAARERLIDDLVTANHILANEGVLDGFGHVSARDPEDGQRFLLSRSRSPSLVEHDDIRVFDLDSRPMQTDTAANYSERVIHGCAYRARPDVMAVCHFHAGSVLPFANTGTKIQPVVHLGALMGHDVAMWDARDEFGSTSMLVSTLDQGHSLARALGQNWSLVLRRHGAMVVGRSLPELVFRSIVMMLNAEVQLRAQSIGEISPLTDDEIDLSTAANLQPSVQQRVWDYWCSRLQPGNHMPVALPAGQLLALDTPIA